MTSTVRLPAEKLWCPICFAIGGARAGFCAGRARCVRKTTYGCLEHSATRRSRVKTLQMERDFHVRSAATAREFVTIHRCFFALFEKEEVRAEKCTFIRLATHCEND